MSTATITPKPLSRPRRPAASRPSARQRGGGRVTGCGRGQIGPRSLAVPASRPAPASGPVGKQSLRLTGRGQRMLTSLALLVFAFCTVMVGRSMVMGVFEGAGYDRTTTVQVGAGQDLWQLAEATNPGADPKRVIAEIAELNGLRDAADVRAGAMLVVPLY